MQAIPITQRNNANVKYKIPMRKCVCYFMTLSIRIFGLEFTVEDKKIMGRTFYQINAVLAINNLSTNQQYLNKIKYKGT